MSHKLFLSVCCAFLMILSFGKTMAQNDSLLIDSLRSEVARVEFVRLEPVCRTVKRRPEGKLFKRKLKLCSPDPVLHCVYLEGKGALTKDRCSIDYARLSGNVDIGEEDIQPLISLLFETEKVSVLNMCYSPRHGILFYDDENVELGFVEICFECHGTQTCQRLPDIGVLTGLNFIELRKLFEKYGL